jgi:hypothetical protein
LVAALLPWSASARAETIRLEPSADNTLFEDAEGDTSNGAGPALYVGRNNQNSGRARRAVIAFDLDAIPRGASVDSVVLELHLSNSSDLVPRSLTVHRLDAPWGEGQSMSAGGTGTDATTGDATWVHAFFPDRSWLTPGGDFEALVSATQIVGATGSCAWVGRGLVADVMAWLQQPATNHGWLILGDESSPGTARRFDSRENPVSAMHPSLTIHFSPTRSARAMTWGSIKAAYR